MSGKNDGICIFDGCDRPRRCKRLRTGHYKQHLAGVTLRPLRYMPLRSDDDETRLMSRASRADGGCLIFEPGALNQHSGYGALFTSRGREYAHRTAYRVWVGEIPEGMIVNHICGTRSCIEPSHLEVVTHQENSEYRTVMQSNNTSGYRSVYPMGSRWRVQIQRGGMSVHIGCYDTLEEAAAAVPRGGIHRSEQQAWNENR